MAYSMAVRSKTRYSGKKWIQKAIGKTGTSHKQLGISLSKKIPISRLKSAAKKGGKLAKRANLALTLRKFRR